MNFHIITEKPLWFSFFCLLAGVVVAGLLYYKDNKLGEVKPWLKITMAVSRCTVISLLAFLLLSPLVRTISRTVEKPVIVFAQDNSQSILNGTTRNNLDTKYKPGLDNLIESLKADFDVRVLGFGDQVTEKSTFGFDDRLTNYSTLFKELNVRFSNRNLAGIIMATDGIYNQGSSPLYSLNKIKAPVYTIAMGDTTVRKDLILTRVNHNKLAFVGNSFPLEIVVDAKQCAGLTTILTIEKDSQVLISRSLPVSGNRFHQTVPVFLEAREKGIHHYVVKLSVLKGEINLKNNTTDIFIDVAEGKQKILVLYNSPHPDLAAIKNVIESSRNYELTSIQGKDFTGNLNDYNLVILHQIPAVGKETGTLNEKIRNTDASLFFILGAQTSVPAFNTMETGISIADHNGKVNELQAKVESNFPLFTMSEGLAKNFISYPPLTGPFGNYKTTNESYTLFFQQIGQVITQQPLLLFSTGSKHKNGVLGGEGFWKWRLHEFSLTNKHDVTSEILLKTIQYLAMKEKKSPFRLLHKNNFSENEPLIFDAELYNESGELINTPDVKISIYNIQKTAYPYTFSKTERAYTLNAGFFPVGNYSFKASVNSGGKIYSEAGEFSVSALQLEQAESIADHQLLYALSEKSGGKMVYPAAMSELLSLLKSREDIKPVIYTQKKLQDLINLKWVFFLLMGMLSMEWFLRKRSGAY